MSSSPPLERRMLARALDQAGILLWSARVRRTGDEDQWEFTIQPESAQSPLLCYTETGIPGQLWPPQAMPDAAASRAAYRDALAREEHGYRHEFRLVQAGRTLWLEEVVEIERLAPDAWLLAGVTRDVTERKQAAVAAQRATADFRRVLERTDCLIWNATVIDDGSPTFLWEFTFTPSALQRRLFPRTEPGPGSAIYDGYASAHLRENDRRAVEALRAGAPGYEQEFALTRESDGHTFWLREQVSISPEGPGRWHLTGLMIDFTARKLAEQAGYDATVRLHQLLERADCILWEAIVTDDGSHLWEWNFRFLPSALQRAIFPHHDDRVVHDIYVGFDVPQLAEMLVRAKTAMSSGAPGYEQQFDLHRCEDGAVFWLQERVAITALAPGRWQLVGVMIEITAAKVAAQAQQDTELRLHNILERVECVLWQGRAVPAGDGGYDWRLSVSPSSLFRRIFRREPLPVETKLWDAPGFALDFGAMRDRAITGLAGDGRGYEQEFRCQTPDTIVWLREQAAVVRRDGATIHLVGVITDITARKLAELQLAQEKELLAVTLRAMDEAVVTLDARGAVTFLNRVAEELLQTRLGQAMGRHLPALGRLVTGLDGTPADWPLAPALADGQSLDLPAEIQLVRRDGTLLRIEGCLTPLRDLESRAQGAVLVFRDVSERHLLQAHLQRTATLESVGLLAGGIAHDFNNILTAIMGNLSLAQDEAPPGSLLAESLAEADAAANRARGLSQQLLTFAKGGDPVLAAVDLGAVIREVSQFTVRGTRVVCAFDLAPDPWPARADRGQIAQIVQNLVLNAVQAMPDGGSVHLATANVILGPGPARPLAPGDYVRLTITDTGPGIAPEDLARLFTPYFTTRREGHGLGLAVVYSIVRKHDGAIEVRSTPGVGTTFEIHLPAARDQSIEPAESSRGAARPMQGRLLLLEDEAPIRAVLSTYLQRLGLTIDTAREGSEAVALYRAALAAGRRYDLLIMDLTIPGGMGGREAMAAILALDPQAQAIVASGYSSDPVLAQFRDFGFCAAAPKPFSLPRLAELIGSLLAARPVSV